MKLGRKDVLVKPHKMTLSFFDLATIRPSNLAPKVEKWAFLRIFRQFRALTGDQGPNKAYTGILGSAGAHA